MKLMQIAICGALVAAGLSAAGCGSKETPAPVVKPLATDCANAVRGYFEALAHKDWPAAYAHLDAASKSACSPDQYSKLAEVYYKQIGFAPSEVVVQSCDERGAEAVAHVSLKGIAGSSLKFFKDAASLHREASGWAVALSPRFGKPAASHG